LEELGIEPLPSLRTINRILSRHELTHRRTGRYESKGRKYPKLPGQTVNEVHQMDYVGPCFLKGPVRFYSLNSVDLATGRCAISPVLSKAGQHTLDAIWSTWCRLGIPLNVQVDNELVFYGSRQHPRGMGILIRLCLLNDVQPWFIPMAEPWRNGVIEKFNDHFQTGFLRRVVMRGEKELRRKSLAFEHKHNTRYRYSKLKGQTPKAALNRSHHKIRFSSSLGAPRHCPSPTEAGTIAPSAAMGCWTSSESSTLCRQKRVHAAVDRICTRCSGHASVSRIKNERTYSFVIGTSTFVIFFFGTLNESSCPQLR
jgi:putative transposase